jgi:hypothetical protein
MTVNRDTMRESWIQQRHRSSVQPQGNAAEGPDPVPPQPLSGDLIEAVQPDRTDQKSGPISITRPLSRVRSWHRLLPGRRRTVAW